MLTALLHAVGGLDKVTRHQLDSASSMHLLQHTCGRADVKTGRAEMNFNASSRRINHDASRRQMRKRILMASRTVMLKTKIRQLMEELQMMRQQNHTLNVDNDKLEQRVKALEIIISELTPGVAQLNFLHTQYDEQRTTAIEWGVKVFNMALSSPLPGMGVTWINQFTPVQIGQGGCGVVYHLQNEHKTGDIVLKVALEVGK